MNYVIELNNAHKDSDYISGRVKETSPVVEVFNALRDGKDIAPFNTTNAKIGDKAVKFIKELNNRAASGDISARAEINNIRRLSIEPVMLQEIKLLSVFGNYVSFGWNEACEIEVPTYANTKGRIQAPGEDVTYPTIRKKRYTVPTITVSGGHAVDYRKAAIGDMSDENALQEEVRKDIRNKAARYIVENTYNAIKNATGVKYFFEGSGLTQTGVDGVQNKVRRFGATNIWGDFALLAQFNKFAGYDGTTPKVTGISEKVMNEIQDTGLIGSYSGSKLATIPNPYDLSTLNAAGDNFETYLPQGLGFIIPTGANSPVYNVSRGGLTSFTGNDVTTGEVISRFDLEIGTIVVPGQEYKLAMIHDTSLDDLSA